MYYILLWGTVEVKAGFRIPGKISDTKTRKKVFLLSGNDTLLKSNVKGGIFKLKGKTDFPKLTFLAFEEKEEKIPLFLENTDFTVNISSESVMVEDGTHQKCWNSF